MKNIFLKGCFGLMLIFLCITSSFALEVDTHKALNEYIATKVITPNGFSCGTYLKNQLGFQSGADEKFNSLEVYKWLRDGGEYEDIPAWYLSYLRSQNHFHNPRYTWNTAGLTDTFIGQSAILWALSPRGTQSYGYYSWDDVRDYYLGALILPTKTERDTYFAETFRGLGQLMHLVQDMSVPEHTRNDFHPYGGYEGWLLKQEAANTISTALANPIFFGNSITNISNLFDTDQYDGSNPTIAVGNKIGLSEYTNANFLSPDTIFTEDQSFGAMHYQPYPRKDSVVDPINNQLPPEEITAEDGNVDRPFYVKKTKDGEVINHLANASYFARDLYINLWTLNISLYYQLSFQLDDVVYRNYAALLLPRAVGYSAGLLNYFFRGEIEVTSVYGGLKVKNISKDINDTMTYYTDTTTGATIGDIVIYYDAYDPNDVNGRRTFLIDYPLSTALLVGDEITIPFTPPSDNIKQGRYIVIFYGKLGAEEGAVIGKMTTLITEKIYYVSKRNGIDKIYKMDTDGTNQTIVYDNPNSAIVITKLAPSPDGKILAFTVSGPRIYLLDMRSGNLMEITNGEWGEWPAWSPDGTKIAFQRYLSGHEGIQLFTIGITIDKITGSIIIGTLNQLTNVPNASIANAMPAWSPDGQKIAYSDSTNDANCNNFYNIYLINIFGNPIGSLTCYSGVPTADDYASSWSPDGKEIAFTRRKGDYISYHTHQLNKVDVGTKAIVKLTDSTDSTYDERAPSWSMDGKYIAIESNRDGDYDIWLVDPNGGGYITNLTDSNLDIDKYPAFGR